MCTVTLVRKEGKIIITSNRDERASRPASHKPELQLVGNKKLLFPKDPLAGGSWFVIDDDSNVCLLYTSPSPRDRTRSRMPSSA